MITYSRLAAKIWKLVDYFEPAVIRELKPTDFEELDGKIIDWYNSVPEEVKISSLDPLKMPIGPAGYVYDTQRLQIWTRLRLNQVGGSGLVRLTRAATYLYRFLRYGSGCIPQSCTAPSASSKTCSLHAKLSS